MMNICRHQKQSFHIWRRQASDSSLTASCCLQLSTCMGHKIHEAPAHKDVTQLKSFFGLLNYAMVQCSKFQLKIKCLYMYHVLKNLTALLELQYSTATNNNYGSIKVHIIYINHQYWSSVVSQNGRCMVMKAAPLYVFGSAFVTCSYIISLHACTHCVLHKIIKTWM